jgi:hypothetical protein
MHDAHAQLPFSTPAEKATADLTIGAFFFVMRSCEYVHVTGTRRTKPLRLQNLRFFQNNRVMSLDDPDLCSATALSITFKFQKLDVRNETVHQHVTEHPILCPGLRWAAIVQRILDYPGCNENSLVSTVLTKLVTSAFLETQLQAAVKRIGKDVLGYSHLDIGTHSIRSGGAMAMYLAGVPVFTIMFIGRWSSNAFLQYIHMQVLQFRVGVSKCIISTKSQDFFTLPNFDPEHPRTRAHQTNFQYSPQQSGPTRRPSTPDHVFESLLPRFKLSI